MTAQRAFRDRLGEDWVIESVKTQQLLLEVDSAGLGRQRIDQQTVPRMTTRDRSTAVALPATSLTIETTSYGHYPDFRAILERAFRAAFEILQPDGVARLGLRYIDEIRVPNVSEGDPSRWGEWLNASLLPPSLSEMEELGMPAITWEGATQFAVAEDKRLLLRYGTRSGYAVAPEGPLRRLSLPAPGPLYFLDFDCFWEPGDIPEFDVDGLLDTCDSLRSPVRTLFDLLITDKLRDEVFMAGGSDA